MPLWTPPPEWLGQDTILLGGGSSLTDYDFSRFKGRNTIGCNDAFRLGPEIIKICAFGDASFFHHCKWELEKFSGKVVTCAPGLLNLKLSWLLQMKRLRDGLHSGSTIGWNYSTGAMAINLALSLGANRIFLLGYDVGKRLDGKTHWHDYRHKLIQDETYRRFVRGFSCVHASLKRFPEIQVVNVTDGTSQLPLFERITFEEFHTRCFPDLVRQEVAA